MGRAITFDTLAYAKKLIAAGVPEKQAEVQAETFAEIIDEQIATKQDLKELESRLQVEIREVESRLQVEIREVESRLQVEIYRIKSDVIKWVAGMMIAQTTAIIAAVAALIKLL